MMSYKMLSCSWMQAKNQTNSYMPKDAESLTTYYQICLKKTVTNTGQIYSASQYHLKWTDSKFQSKK